MFVPFSLFLYQHPHYYTNTLSNRLQAQQKVGDCENRYLLCDTIGCPRGTISMDIVTRQTSERAKIATTSLRYLMVTCVQVPVRKFRERLPTAWANLRKGQMTKRGTHSPKHLTKRGHCFSSTASVSMYMLSLASIERPSRICASTFQYSSHIHHHCIKTA